LIREQLEKQMQTALAAKQAELEKQRAALSELEKQRQAATAQAATAATATRVAETERNMLRDNLTDLKKEVALVRLEKDQLQTQTSRLTDGVGQLAAKSGELAKEIRENTPINMNLMFSEFMSNRVDVAISAHQPVLIGSGVRLKEAKSVLIHDGRGVYAIIHVGDTPFSLTTPLGMDHVSARVARGSQALGSGPLTFITADPRLAVVPVNAQQALALNLKLYPVAKNPFKFTEAVLVNRGGKHYGEVEFKLDARTPDYVRMKNRILSRVLQGEFSPSTGDIVLSKTGEFLGVMANSDYCAVIKSFETLPGYTFDEKTSTDMVRNRLLELNTRLARLPAALQ
jgi:X-X-X-Leu-X-X-Gly heptad repeat protein